MSGPVLAPGSCIGAQGGPRGRVTAVCTAEGAQGPTHLLTVGHLFGSGDVAVVSGDTPVGALVFDGLDLGWRERVDVGLVALAPGVDAPRPGGVAGAPGAQVRLGAEVAAAWPVPAVRFTTPARPGTVVLRDVFGVSPPRTAPGDSGAPVLDARGEAIVGAVIGTYRGLTVFAPLPAMLRAASRALGVALRVW